MDGGDADTLLALGLLGDPSVIDLLLQKLAVTELAGEAALALHLITGAPLFEQIFVPEEIERDELLPEEIEKLDRGESLTPPGEPPRGTTITRISRKEDGWHQWWAKGRDGFQAGIRYRSGKPFAPALLLAGIVSTILPRRIRQLAYDELVIRYGIDTPFETDMPVSRQRQAVRVLSELITKSGTAFHDGEWYFAGQVQGV
jgi:hypothetical protein